MTEHPAHVPAPPPRLPQARFLDRRTPPSVGTLVAMTGLSALAMSVFLPSLPKMTAYFQTDYGLMQLSVALYLAMNAALQLVIGPLSDVYGRRPVIIGGFVIFLIATLGCIFAPTVGVFLAFRMLQAVIVVAMALSRAIVRDMHDEGQSASVLGYVTMGMSVVPMVGPAIGGWLDHAFGWQASFWLLFGAGLAVLALVWADLGETGTSRGVPFAAQVREYPELLRAPRFWGYCAASALASGAFFAYLGGAPFVGSTIFGLDPGTLGMYFGAPAVGYFFGNFISGRYSARVGVNLMALAGSALIALGMGLSLAVFAAGHGSAGVFFGFMTFVGLGNGMVLPNATAGLLSVRPRLAGTASGLGGVMMIGGGAALSALAGQVLDEGSGALPLLWIMFLSGLGAVLAMAYVIARTRAVARRP
jgi:DHA1 family bicyclomycin/chloramphenicol resistance-like MFS transporter